MSATNPRYFEHIGPLVPPEHLDAQRVADHVVDPATPAHQVLEELERDRELDWLARAAETERAGAWISSQVRGRALEQLSIDFAGHQDVADTIGRLAAQIWSVRIPSAARTNRKESALHDLMARFSAIHGEQCARIAGEGFFALQPIRQELQEQFQADLDELAERAHRLEELKAIRQLSRQELAAQYPDMSWGEYQDLAREHQSLATRSYWSDQWKVPSRSVWLQADDAQRSRGFLDEHDALTALVDPRGGATALSAIKTTFGCPGARTHVSAQLVNAMIHASNGFTD